jgi:hypothetical protein
MRGRKRLCYVPCLSNFCINSDKHPANYCVIFYGSEVVSVVNFVVGVCALRDKLDLMT